jgi:hypothetical protein
MPMTLEDSVVCVALSNAFRRAVREHLDLRWTFIRVEPFKRNVDPVVMGGVEYRPTMAYDTKLLGRRPDGVHFYLTITVGKDYTEIKPVTQMLVVDSIAKDTALGFNEFLDCVCQVEAPCPKHHTEMQQRHDAWLKWHDDNLAHVAEPKEEIRRLSMKTQYAVQTFRSVEEFETYLAELTDSWELHSFCPGVVQMIIAVFRKPLPLVPPQRVEIGKNINPGPETGILGKV